MSFSRDLFPVFEYEAGGVRLRKTVACVHGENTTIVFWELLEAERPFVLELRPFVAFRDHHRLAQANETFDASEATFEDGIFRARPYAGVPDLYLSVPGAEFEAAPTWYRRFEYAREIERGLDVHEDLFSHGVFRVDLGAVRGYGAIASTGSPAGRDAWMKDGFGIAWTDHTGLAMSSTMWKARRTAYVRALLDMTSPCLRQMSQSVTPWSSAIFSATL